MLKIAHDLLLKHSRTGVFFDTNLMVVFVVGSYNPGWLGKHRRTQAFDLAETKVSSTWVERLHSKVGLTDAILIRHSADHLIITADFPLARRIESMGRDVVNFNHIRSYAA